MPKAAVRFNIDGTTRVTLVDDESGKLVPDFPIGVNAFPDDDGFIVQIEALDGTHSEVVTTISPDNIMGARDQAVGTLIKKASEFGYVVTGFSILEEQEELPG